jgi:hypothetical protein
MTDFSGSFALSILIYVGSFFRVDFIFKNGKLKKKIKRHENRFFVGFEPVPLRKVKIFHQSNFTFYKEEFQFQLQLNSDN